MSCGQGCSHDHHDDLERFDEEDQFEPCLDEQSSSSDSEYVKVTSTLPSSIIKTIITPAPDSSLSYPNKGDVVSVHYVGTLHSDGSKFDSSRDRDEQFKFTLGVGQVIKGWDLGIASMRVGERAKFTLPSEYAYGKRGSPPKIPADATLDFDVELFDFSKPVLDVFRDGSVLKTAMKTSKKARTPRDGEEVELSISEGNDGSIPNGTPLTTFQIGSANSAFTDIPADLLSGVIKSMSVGERAAVQFKKLGRFFSIALHAIHCVEDISYPWRSKRIFKLTKKAAKEKERVTEEGADIIMEIESTGLVRQTIQFVSGSLDHAELFESAARSMAVGEEAEVWSADQEGGQDPKLGINFTRVSVKLIAAEKNTDFTQTAERIKESGSFALKQGRTRLAISRYLKASEYPECATACHLNLALCYLKIKEGKNAEESARKALSIDGANEKGRFRLAQALDLQKKDEECLQVLRGLVEGGNVDARNLWTEVKARVQKGKQAEKGLIGRMFKGI